MPRPLRSMWEAASDLDYLEQGLEPPPPEVERPPRPLTPRERVGLDWALAILNGMSEEEREEYGRDE